jgi:porphobilinogen synthase
MMNGRIAAIRTQLVAMGFDDVSIMSCTAKFNSQFYGPFRDACHSAPNANGLQNRKRYQILPFNTNDAIASALRDEKKELMY